LVTYDHYNTSNTVDFTLLSRDFVNAMLVMFLTFDMGYDTILLPCQWKYWHRTKNRLRDKTGFGMYNPQNVEKSGFGQSVYVSVFLSVCLSCCRFSRELSQA